MISLFMDMATRFDPVFPEAGGLERLVVREQHIESSPDPKARTGDTSFHPDEVAHIRKVLGLLGDDQEARSTLMSWLVYAQMKCDVAGW
jgi:hypothetical protein